MALTLVAAVAAHLLLDGFNHVVLVVEGALIAEFGAYWLVQTVELWNTSTRDELVDAECRPRGEKAHAGAVEPLRRVVGLGLW